MTLRVKPILSALALCAAFVSTNANALIYNLTGDIIQTGNTFDITIDVDGIDVTSVSGMFDTSTITGITVFGGSNNFVSDTNYGFSFLIDPSTPAGDAVRVFTTDSYIVGTTSGVASSPFPLANVSVSAVPEPETYAMFLAGLGLLGFARRVVKS